MSNVHLIVLQHGLWGSPVDVENLTKYLRQTLQKQQGQIEEELAFLTSGVNARRLTYDGIDVCGSRLAQLVQDTIQQYAEQGKQVIKLSLIGYSLGGVISRFAAGKLYVAGVFEEVQPMNLITIASPHLGSFREPSGLWARFFNSQVPIIASRTGRQLMLVDSDYSVPWLTHQQELHNKAHRDHTTHKVHQQQQQQDDDDPQHQQEENAINSNSETRAQQQQQQQQRQGGVVLPPGVGPSQAVPLLLLMAHPAGPFWRALKHFKTRICAANIRYDSMVPYCTAALCVTNPYEQAQPIPVNPDKYPSVVRPAKPEEEQHITPMPIRGRSRLLYFYIFMPMFPFFWAYSAISGILHHRQMKQRPLDLSWLQQYSAEHNPFSKQPSRQASIKLKHNRRHQQQWQRQQQQQRLSAAAELLETEGAEVQQNGPTAAAAGGGGSELLLLLPGSRTRTSSSGGLGNTAAAAAGGGGHVSPFHSAAVTSEQQQDASKDASTGQPAAAAAAVPEASAAISLEQALTSEGVLEREGIIEEPYAVHQQQQWMAQQLYDKLPSCWVPERAPERNSSSSSSSSSDAGKPGLPHGGAEEPTAASSSSSSSSVVAEAPTSKAGVQAIAEAQSTLITQPASSSGNKQQQDGTCSKEGDGQRHSPFTVAALDPNTSSSGFKSAGGWHRVDVWMGHMHAHAAIVIRDKRFEGESRDFFLYLADHINL